MITKDPVVQSIIERIVRESVQYGWWLGANGFPEPQPQIEWRDGIPVVVADGVGSRREAGHGD